MLFIDHCAMTLHVQKIKSSKLCYVCGMNRKQPFATLKNHECTCVCRQCARPLKSCYYCRPVLSYKYSIVYTPVCLVVLRFLHSGINFLRDLSYFESANEPILSVPNIAYIEEYNGRQVVSFFLAIFDVVVVLLDATILYPLLLIFSASMVLFIVYRDFTVVFSLFSWVKALVSDKVKADLCIGRRWYFLKAFALQKTRCAGR